MSINPIDKADRRILSELQSNGRLSNQELAEKVNLTPSPCLRRVRKLEEEGWIENYRAVLNRQRLGLGLTVFTEIKVEGHGVEGICQDLRDALIDMPEVVSFHIVSGEADYLLEVVVPDLEHYEKFLLKKLLKYKTVKEVHSNFAIKTIKAHDPLPLAHLQQDG